MVSQPDHSALAIRGSSSVVSARSSSRAHASSRSKRYNRSHAGGTSYAPQNEFPVFSHSGDVEIFIRAGGTENRYLLHRHTLTRSSGFFEASTSQQWSKAAVLPSLPEPSSRELARIGEDGASSSGASSEVARHAPDSPQPRRRWRYELDQGSDRDDIPMLVQLGPDAKRTPVGGDSRSAGASTATGNSIFGGPPAAANALRHKGHSHTHSSGSFFRSVANLSLAPTHGGSHHPEEQPPLSQADADLLRDYDNLFRIFYNYSPVLDGISIGDAYVQCKSLLNLADQYDALAVVGPRVDHHLLQFQSRLWKQIAKYPVSYLRLGYLSRSKVIFQEALIHVVGQWPAGERSIRHAMPDIVLDIIEDKVDELEETVSRVEGRLFRLSLTNSRGERVSPQSNYLDWLAVSLFRQWLAEHTTLPPPSKPPQPSSDRPGGGRNSTSGSYRDASSRMAATVQASTALPSLASVGRTYRLLGSPSGGGYLSHDECKKFLKLTPDLYSRDNLRRFEKRVDELKAAAREVVRPLMGSGLELELERGALGMGDASLSGGPMNVGGAALPAPSGTAAVMPASGSLMQYLTCVRVMKRDLPWEIEG